MAKPAAVLVQFDDVATAQEFITRINGSMEYNPENGKSFRVVGLWRLPSAFCPCGLGERLKMGAFARGEKFGWWVHRDCGRPSVKWIDLAPRLWAALGRNILPGALSDGEPRMTPTHARDHDSLVIVDALKDRGWYDPGTPKRDRQQARREARRAARPRRQEAPEWTI